jgi:uncharacterized protein DUF1440
MLGIAGGLLGASAMNLFARGVVALGQGREAPGAAPGPDREGRGVQPPQSATTADQDATVLAGTAAFRAITGEEPDPRAQQRLGSAAHYAFAAGAGLTYALLALAWPAITSARGAAYGTLVWAAADEGIVPALGLSRGPQEIDAGVHAYALLGHFVFGATLDAVLRYGSVGFGRPGQLA